MIKTRTINGLTEVYTEGGGTTTYLTENFATYNPTFATRKILLTTDELSNYKEVSESEKTKLEQAASAYERPKQWFIDAWNDRARYASVVVNVTAGQFNEDTGYFELNGITDITLDEAEQIMRVAPPKLLTGSTSMLYYYTGLKKSCMPICHIGSNDWTNAFYLTSCKVIRPTFAETVQVSVGTNMFMDSSNLQTVLGVLRINKDVNVSNMFGNCNVLESVQIDLRGKLNLSFAQSPLLSLDSLQYMIDNKTNSTDAATVTLHADAYAKLTDEMIASALEKNLTFVSA